MNVLPAFILTRYTKSFETIFHFGYGHLGRMGQLASPYPSLDAFPGSPPFCSWGWGLVGSVGFDSGSGLFAGLVQALGSGLEGCAGGLAFFFPTTCCRYFSASGEEGKGR